MPQAWTVLIALALVSAAGAGVALSTNDAEGDLTTIEGTVVDVAWNPHWEVAVEYDVRLNDSEGTTYAVELGPPWWWAAVGLPEIEVNDTLSVEGVLHDGNAIEAYTISLNGGDPIVIRDGGKPMWAEVASGRPAKDDE
jgi:hypothetical protein